MSETPDLMSQPRAYTTSPKAPDARRDGRITGLLLLAVMIAAAFFRFYGLNFDQSHNQHPDERFIVGKTIALNWPQTTGQFFDVLHSPLNLRSAIQGNANGDHYPYGSFPVYLTKAAGWLWDTFGPQDDTRPRGYHTTDFGGVTMTGRSLAAVFDLITILLVFLIGRRLYSSRTGLVAGALVAFAVTHIQIAHFYASDVFLVTFMMGALYFSVRLMQSPSWVAAAGAGACLGLAVASKVSIAPFALIVVAAVLLRALYRKRTRLLGAELGDPVGTRPASAAERDRSFWGHLLRGGGYVLIAAVMSLVFFSVSEPYVFLLPVWNYIAENGIGAAFNGLAGARAAFEASPFWGGIREQTGIQSGQADVPYTRQYVGTVPLLYHLQNMVMWGLSPLPGLTVVAGFIVGIWRAITRVKPADTLLLLGALPYFATILTLEAKWMRYMLPLVPIFCLLGAAMLMRGWAWMEARAARRPVLALSKRPIVWLERNSFKLATGLAVGGAFLWAVAFMNIYSQEHSRVQASRWIYDNVPPQLNIDGTQRQTRTSGEEWDDLLPLDVAPSEGSPGHTNGIYAPVNWRMYEDPPPDQEFEYIKSNLAQTDYYFAASNRLYGSLRHLPWRYPVQNKFYELLYAGKLGFELVHSSHVTPELLGIRFDDQSADESFTVYDHPRADVFKKTSNLTDEQLRILFSSVLNRPGGSFSRERHFEPVDDKSLAYDQPLSTLGDTNDYAWNPLAQPDTQWIGVILWLLLAELLGLIALPIIFTISRRLPDRGYPLAKIAGLMLLAWGVWVVSSAKLIPFTVWGIVLVLLLLVGLSALCFRLGARRAIAEYWAEKRTLVIFYEGLFLAAFGAFLIIRMLNPDLWHPVLGGEKTMEFGFLNAVLRSPWMPPADPFFAGGYINYYYYGQFIMAVMMKLVGADPGLAINLAIPLLYALTFTAGASIAYNVVALSRERRGDSKPVSVHGMAFGFLSGILMLVIGNLYAAYQWLVVARPDIANGLIQYAITHGFAEQSIIHPSMSGPDFWGASRLIKGTINEFPYWSFLFADFHPHLIDMAFTLLAVGLALNLALAGPFRRMAEVGWRAKAGAALSWLWGPGWAGLLMFGVLAVNLGTLFATNSWDFPTFAGVVGACVLVALLVAHIRQPGAATDGPVHAPRNQMVIAYVGGAITTGLLLLAGLVAALPFLLSFKNVLQLGIRLLVDGGRIADLPALPEGTPVPFGEQMHRTTLGEFLLVWGLFIFVALSYLLVRLWQFGIDWWAARKVSSRRELQGTTVLKPQAPALGQGAAFLLRPMSGTGMTPALAGSGAGGGATLSGPVALTAEPRQEIAGEAEPREGGATALDALNPEGPGSPDAEQEAVVVLAGEGRTEDDASVTHPAAIMGSPGESEVILVETPVAPEDSAPQTSAAEENIPLTWLADAHEQTTAAPLVRPGRAEQPGVIPLWAGGALLVVTLALVVLQVAMGQYLVALLVGLIGGTIATTLAGTRSPASLLTGVLMVSALTVALGVELVYLADHLRGGDMFRMNTVFKFYIQVWLLFGAAAAAAIYYIIFGLRDDRTYRESVQAVTNSRPYDGEPLFVQPEPDGDLRGGSRPVARSEELTQETIVPYDFEPHGNLSVPVTESSETPQAETEPAQYYPPAPLRNWLAWQAGDEQLTRRTGDGSEVRSGENLLSPPNGHTPEDPVATGGPAVEERGSPHPAAEDRLPTTEYLAALTAPKVGTADVPSSPLRLALVSGWSVLMALFLLASLAFTLYDTPNRLQQRFGTTPPIGTLDGRAYMQYATYGPINAQGGDGASGQSVMVNLKYDYEAIQWLNRNVPGLRVIAEGPYEYYRDGGMRAAANTGLPMIVGGLHQGEQRYDWLVGSRDGEARMLFTTPDPQTALTILSKYDVDYIYLGQLEQARAGNGIAKFDQMARAGVLQEVFRSQTPKDILGTIIYKVVKNDKVSPEKVVGAPVQGQGVAGISITPLPTPTFTPQPTPPTDDPELKGLIDAVSADPSSLDKHQRLVDWYRDHGYFLDAARELEAMMKQRPQDVAIRHMLGDAYQQAGALDKALAEWEAARDIEPDNPSTHNKLGIAYTDRRRYDDAIAEFQAALSKDPLFNESAFHLGEAYDNKGEHSNAVKAYQQAIDAVNKAPADRKQGMEPWANEARKRLSK